MKIKNAIIIHGPGRSGTTLLSNILSLHDDLAWISGYVNKYPNRLNLTMLNIIQRSAFIEKLNRNKNKFPRPSEAYNFWNYYVPEFNQNELEAISDESAQKGVKAINMILKRSRKDRFIAKITGNSRFQTIEALFEDPYILWIDRNPESVIMSYYKHKWRYKNKEKVFNSLPKKALIKQYSELYKHFKDEKKHLERFNLKILQYEDLVENRDDFFNDVCSFVNLPMTDKFKSLINSWNIKQNTNTSYRDKMTEEELDYLRSEIGKI